MISGLLPNFPRTGQKAQLSKSEGQEDSRASNLLTFHLNPLLTQKKWFYLEFWRWKFLILKLMIQKISPSTQGSMVYIICPTSETWVPDSPAPLCGFGQLTDLPRNLPSLCYVDNSTTDWKACYENIQRQYNVYQISESSTL